MTGSLVTPAARARVRGLMTPIAIGLGRLGLTPNALTVIGFGIACVAGAMAAAQLWLVAGLLVILGAVFDVFDGALARATGTTSRLGAFMDSVFDRWGEGVVYVGIVWGSLSLGYERQIVLASAAMASAFMVSYTRAKAESVGFTPGTGMANVGVAPREVRIAILTAGLLAAGVLGSDPTTVPAGGAYAPQVVALEISLALIAGLATITTIQRIVVTINQARSQDHG